MAAAEVAVLRWPAEAARRGELRRAGRATLWLVEGGAAAPEQVDWLEDWARVPADERDLAARAANLAARCSSEGVTTSPPPAPPVLDDDGVLRTDRAWVPLPPVEHRLVTALVDRYGGVVSREALGSAGWPAGSPGRNALDVHVLRLRRRLRPLGLEIRTVRSRGYLLESAPPAAVGGKAVANPA